MSQVDWRAFEAYVEKTMEKENIAGLAVAVSKNNNVMYAKGFGTQNIESNEVVTPDTIFGIASVTKSFTALAIMKLANEGLLNVHDAVIEHLPNFKINGVNDMSTIKIHHLLSHTTGLPPMKRREEINKLDEHIAYLASEEYTLLGEPGAYLSYCNDTFLLLGAIIEKVTGKLYRRYMSEHILSPLQMDRSTYSLEEVKKFANVSTPYNYDRHSKTLVEADWPTLGNYEVGGGIRSNVMDLLRYGRVYVDSELSETVLGMNSEDLSDMWQPVYPIARYSSYGYALQITPNYAERNVTLVEHGGGQPGVSSNFGFVPEEKIVVTVLTNVGGVPAGDIWLAAVNTALGIELSHKKGIEPHAQLSMEQLQRFEGTYTSAEGGHVTIYINNGVPTLETDGQTFELRPSDEHTLVLEKTGRPIRFYFNEHGDSWAMLFGVRMLTRRLTNK